MVQARDIGEVHFHGDGTRDAAHAGRGRAGVRPGRPLSGVTDPFHFHDKTTAWVSAEAGKTWVLYAPGDHSR